MSTRRSKRQCWLIYEEGDSHDGGITPLLVVPTKALALQVKEDIESFVSRACARLEPMFDLVASDISEEEYAVRYEKREQVIKRLRWPHGIKRDFWDWNFTVGVMPLPYVLQESR